MKCAVLIVLDSVGIGGAGGAPGVGDARARTPRPPPAGCPRGGPLPPPPGDRVCKRRARGPAWAPNPPEEGGGGAGGLGHPRTPGRVPAPPSVGGAPQFFPPPPTPRDYAVPPPEPTLLDRL